MTVAFMCLTFYWIFGIAMNIYIFMQPVSQFLCLLKRILPLCVITISISMVPPFAHTFFYLLQIQADMK